MYLFTSVFCRKRHVFILVSYVAITSSENIEGRAESRVLEPAVCSLNFRSNPVFGSRCLMSCAVNESLLLGYSRVQRS